MDIRLVASSIGNGITYQYLMSYIVNGSVAIDAGCIGLLSPLDDQFRIRHVLLSHSHLDHIATLPIFLDNVYQDGPECVSIYGHPETLDSLRTDFFNGRVWPDLVELEKTGARFMKLIPLQPEETVRIESLEILPVELDHLMPTYGFVLTSEGVSVAIISDTAPTERIWEVLRETPNLEAIFLEASFPDSMQWLAEKSKHLCSSALSRELDKLGRPVRTIAVHIKPAYHEQIVRELSANNRGQIEIGETDRVYRFTGVG